MSTTEKPLKYLWSALYKDGHTIDQPVDDRYSQHDDNAEYNPSSFRDLLDYEAVSPLASFALFNPLDEDDSWSVDLVTGTFVRGKSGTVFYLEQASQIPLTDRKLHYQRVVRKNTVISNRGEVVEEGDPYVAGYEFGYVGKDREGKSVSKFVSIYNG